jgi:hypothetical protein
VFVRRFVVAVVAAFLTVGAMPVVPAYAEPAWTPPERPGTGYEPTLAGNDRGDAVAAGTTRDGLQVSVRPRAGRWSRPEVVPGSLDANRANVVVDEQGNVAVAFLTGGDCDFDVGGFGNDIEEDYEVHVAYREAGGTWRVKTMDGTMRGCESNTPVLAVDGAGTVTAAWHADGIRVTQRPLDGAWTKPTRLGGGVRPSVIDGPDGAITIVWHDQGHVVASSGSGVGRWASPVFIGESDRPYEAVQMARDGQRNLVAAWIVRDQIASATKPAGQGWLPPETLPQPPRDASARMSIGALQVAAAELTHTITWTQADLERPEGGAELVATTRPSGDSWGEPAVLSNDTHYAIGANAAGTTVVYTTSHYAGGSLRAVHRPVGGEWSRPTTLALADRSRGNWTVVDVLGLRSGMFTAVLARGRDIMFRDFVDDSRAPSAQVVTPRGPVTLSGRVRVSWSGRDDLAGVRHMDLRLRSAGRRGGFSDWRRSLTRSTATSVVRTVDPGQTACYSVRARDRVGNQGAWSKDRCVTAPVDERAATASAGWTKLRSKAAYRGTLLKTDRHGSRLTLPGVTARRIGLVARTCSGCGTVAVLHGGRRVATFDLGSRKTRNKRVLLARAYPRLRSGKVVVRVVSDGNPVHLDGIFARR